MLIRPVRPEDTALYRDFLADVSAEDLRLRFFARIAELSADEIDKLGHLNYQHEMAFIALDEATGRALERRLGTLDWPANGSAPANNDPKKKYRLETPSCDIASTSRGNFHVNAGVTRLAMTQRPRSAS